jgi:cytochrome c553
MRRLCFAVLLFFGFITMLARCGPAVGSTVFKKPFQQRYEYRSVSCYACHMKGKDENGKPLGKEVLNELGKEMKKQFAEYKFGARIEEVKKADAATKKEVHAEIAKEFLEAIEKFEEIESPSGEKWGVLFKAGSIEGVKKRE